MSEFDKLWSSVAVDLEKYKAGTVAEVRNSSYGNCGCSDCMSLKGLRDKILAARNGTTFFGTLRNMRAVAEKEKMSLIVEEEGFYSLEPISKQTDGRFETVYFPQPGKYSFVSIYKAARTAPDGLMLIDDEIIAAFGEDGVTEGFKNAFGKVFVMGSLEGEAWGTLKNKINLAIQGVDPEEDEILSEVSFDGVYLVNDRYIPLFFFANTFTIITSDTGDNKVCESIPGLPSDDSVKSMNYIRSLASKLPKAYGFGDDKHAIPFAYDTETHTLVTGIDPSQAIHCLINENKDKFSETIQNVFGHVLSPLEFADAMVQDFAKNGASEFEITEFWPKHVTARWSHWSSHDKLDQSVTFSGYLAGVSFQGKPCIGGNGSARGNIHIRFNPEEGRPWLMKSPWCQRLNTWAKKNHGVIDQLYDIWGLADWLSGPFAEKNNLISKEAPCIFMGNKMVDRKKSAMDKLRARLNQVG